jgi:hypothetical protein
VLLLAGGGWGWRAGYVTGPTSPIAIVLVVLVILLLFGVIGGPRWGYW